MQNNILAENFRFHRSKGTRAYIAIERARDDMAKGKRRYTSATYPKVYANPFHEAWGYKNCKWIESGTLRLREIGSAYDVARREHSRAIDHTAWFLDDFQDDSVTPMVFQLPARNGTPFFAFGYADPFNPDCALLCFDNSASDLLEAARAADSLTERMAEQEREYRRAWQAGQDYASLASEIAESRQEIRNIAREIRGSHIKKDSVICATLREAIKKRFAAINRAREERETLFFDYGHEEAFKDH